MNSVHFTVAKVFSATKARDRGLLGDRVTEFLADFPELEVVDKRVRQSSDAEFHCLTIVLFLRPRR